VQSSPSISGSQIPSPVDPTGYARRADDPLSTVGLALLAYGLVQLLSKVIDRMTTGRSGLADARGAFGEEDRKRLERSFELLAAGDQRLQRIAEAGATQQKLVGQVLDELRESTRKHEHLARKINAVWNRIGSRNDDSK
jgi:hypothetical protein